MLAWLQDNWPLLLATFDFGVAAVTSAHVVLYKRDTRAAVAWAGLVWLAPLIGAALYWLLGVNRIRRRAAQLMRARHARAVTAAGSEPIATADENLSSLAYAGGRLARRPLLPGNAIEPLENGDAAYPAMLDAIDNARASVALVTYIFDNDAAGARFVEALARAVARGVAVRVLIDAVGARYSLPSIVARLRRAGVPVAKFLPTWKPFAFNLRNHRKILVVDGALAFSGGMNIRHGHVLGEQPAHPVRDLHFRLAGPVVAQLMGCFAEDWAFATGESLSGEMWYPPLEQGGSILARAVTSGPDDDFEVLRHLILAALATARRSLRVLTPYFVPDAALVTALNVAALRGVAVDIVIPEKSNIRLAQWAATALLWQILQHGCRVHLAPPPLDHAKLLVVDEAWALIGSANWDARSLRLNFELNVECYDPAFAARLAALIDTRIAAARRVTLADVDGRSLPVRLRDGVAKLFAPYL
jgi:cardiolipin synthase